ncbi:MAG: Fe-S cluster assembly protein SufD, partial [Bacteroidota bacterium]
AVAAGAVVPITRRVHRNPTKARGCEPKSLIILPIQKAYPLYTSQINHYFGTIAQSHQDSFIALNTLLFHQALFIYLPPHTILQKPLLIHHLTTHPSHPSIHPRLLLLLGQNSHLTCIENFYTQAENQILINRVAEINLAPHAQLNYYQLQPKTPSPTWQMHYTHIQQSQNAQLNHYTFSLGSKLVRNHLATKLAEPYSEANLYGLYAINGENYIENQTEIDHYAPNTTSAQHYRGTVKNNAKGIFRGTIYVRPHAQKTQANQNHHAWILSPKARIYTQPRLAIQADDVKCTHGATISQPDAAQLFYAQTRGITPQKAHQLLLQSFYDQLIKSVKVLPLQAYLRKNIIHTSLK